jgi:hypothetical protein
VLSVVMVVSEADPLRLSAGLPSIGFFIVPEMGAVAVKPVAWREQGFGSTAIHPLSCGDWPRWMESGHPGTGASVSSTGRLLLAVLGGLADVVRDLIRTRTAEGSDRALRCRDQHNPRVFKVG